MIERLRYWPARKWLWVALVAAVSLLLLYHIVRAWAALTPFVVGLILAWIALPLVRWLEARFLPLVHRPGLARGLAILVTYLGGLALVAGLVYLVAPIVVREFERLLFRLPAMVAAIGTFLDNLSGSLSASLPPRLRRILRATLPDVTAEEGAFLRGVLGRLPATLRRVASLSLAYLVMLVWLIYFMYDAGRFRRGVLGLTPDSVRADVENIGHIASAVAGAYLRGQALLAATTGVLTGLALALLGVGFAALLGLLTAVLDLIPTFGPVLAAIPIVIVAALKSPILALWALLALAGIRELEDLILGPRVIGGVLRIRPAIEILLLVVAGYIWGLLGLILAVPLAALLRDMMRYLYLRAWREGVSSDEALRAVREAGDRRGRQGLDRP